MAQKCAFFSPSPFISQRFDNNNWRAGTVVHLYRTPATRLFSLTHSLSRQRPHEATSPHTWSHIRFLSKEQKSPPIFPSSQMGHDKQVPGMERSKENIKHIKSK